MDECTGNKLNNVEPALDHRSPGHLNRRDKIVLSHLGIGIRALLTPTESIVKMYPDVWLGTATLL